MEGGGSDGACLRESSSLRGIGRVLVRVVSVFWRSRSNALTAAMLTRVLFLDLQRRIC
jgi:hypothetical protein